MPENGIRKAIDDAFEFHKAVDEGVSGTVEATRPAWMPIGGAAVGAIVAPGLVRKLIKKPGRRLLTKATISGTVAGGSLGGIAAMKSNRKRKK